jgi:hypothetical protein
VAGLEKEEQARQEGLLAETQKALHELAVKVEKKYPIIDKFILGADNDEVPVQPDELEGPDEVPVKEPEVEEGHEDPEHENH